MNENIKKTDFDNATMWILFFSIAVILLATGYKFLFIKDYFFIVEASCDEMLETCFFRNCTDEMECGDNSYFKTFKLRAVDYPKCSSAECPECTTGEIACIRVDCDPAVGDACIGPQQEATLQEVKEAAYVISDDSATNE